MSDERRREHRVNVIVFVCTIAAIPLAFWIASSFADDAVENIGAGPDCDSFEFDREAWDPGAETEDRFVQADGLSECRTLVGLDRAEVVSTIGEPTKTEKSRLIYRLPRTGETLSSPRLIVVFGGETVRQSFFHDTRQATGEYGPAD